MPHVVLFLRGSFIDSFMDFHDKKIVYYFTEQSYDFMNDIGYFKPILFQICLGRGDSPFCSSNIP